MELGPKIALIRFQNERVPDVDEPLHAIFVASTDGLHESIARADSWVGSSPLQLRAKPVWPMGAGVAAFKQGPNQLTVLYIEPESRQIYAKWRVRDHAEWDGPAPIVLGHPAAPVGASLAVAGQGPNRWAVVFADDNGDLYSASVDGGDAWNDLQSLTPPRFRFTEPGGNVVAIEQAPGLVSALFVARASRLVNVCWREIGAAAWSGPAPIHALLQPAPPGAGMAAARLPGDRWWVFYVDDNGTLTANRVTGRDPWQEPEAVSAPDTAPPGALVAAVNQTDWLINAFVVDRDGALRLYWRPQDATHWSGPHKLTPAGFAPPGAAVTAAKQNDDVTVVVVAAGDGRPYICWAFRTDSWQGPARISWSRVTLPDVPPAGAGELDTPVSAPIPQSVTGSHVLDSTKRLAQLTGPGTLNPLDKWGAYGVDLGANTDHRTSERDPGRLYIFSGDVTLCDMLEPQAVDAFVDPDRYPPWDADLVAWTDEGTVRKGGFALQVVSNLVRAQPPEQGFRSIYHPFTVERLGLLLTNEGPTGAFSYDGRAYVFIVAAGPTSYLVSSDRPDQPATFALHFKVASSKFWQIAPAVVCNADHPGLPARTGDGLVMIGQGGFPHESVYLAWMPLEPARLPDPARMLFFAGASRALGGRRLLWSPHEQEAAKLFELLPGYTAVSLAWLPGPARWLLLYSLAKAPWESDPPERSPRGPIVARVAADLTAWSREIVLYDQGRDHLEGVFWDNKRSWAYGAFIINRFTLWEPANSEVRVRFLLSLFEPYQLQLVESRIHLPDVPFWRRVVQMFIQFLLRGVLRADR